MIEVHVNGRKINAECITIYPRVLPTQMALYYTDETDQLLESSGNVQIFSGCNTVVPDWGKIGKHFVCPAPNCARVLNESDNYCPECGSKLDWSAAYLKEGD